MAGNHWTGVDSIGTYAGAQTGANMKSKDRTDQTDILSADRKNIEDIPEGVDRRAFLMRSALISSVAVMTGCSVSDTERRASAAPQEKKPPELSPDLAVVKQSKGLVMTTIEEFYKVG